MCSIVIPPHAIPLAPLKLVTMTIAITTDIYLNLGVIAQHIVLNEHILNVSYRKIKRGVFKSGKSEVTNDSEKFKNQCTFDVNVGEKIINTKLFNNGKVINVGCRDVEHAVKAVKIIMESVQGLSGGAVIPRATIYDNKNIKKFFKDDLRKKFGELIKTFDGLIGTGLDLTPFDLALSADDAFLLFEKLISDSTYECDLMYIYTVILLTKNYYDEKNIADNIHTPEFKELLELILNHTSRDKTLITAVFPSYINNELPLRLTYEPEVVLINKSTNSGYYVNRHNLEELLNKEAQIVSCKFDKNRYPGVIIEFQTTEVKVIKIIFFNTGKINITAARTHEQITEAYDFINRFCQTHFDKLILKSEYLNKIKEYEDNLPDQFHIGKVLNSQGIENQLYLLKKSSIKANPRNLRILKIQDYLDKY
jgi:TATA-box binding protein (TBP) (component of TFIID and TFIIIB)